MTMVRYQVILAYDGTQFHGFQRQVNARTVQGVVEAALQQLNWQGGSVLAAGRTDSGVHAFGQVIAFDLDWPHTPVNLLHAINFYLPADVAVLSVQATSPDFHPRYDAISRRYRYNIYCHPVRNPLRERYAWRVWPAVELSVLQRAAGYLTGRHDFAAFGTSPRLGGHTIRTVLRAVWQEEGSNLVFDICADAFLYHMVRRLVCLQVAIGQGNLDIEVIPQHLDNRPGVFKNNALSVKSLAPPQGLVLMEVRYLPETGGMRMNLVDDRQ